MSAKTQAKDRPPIAGISIQCIAHNYAHDSDNRIHSDEYAAQHGFSGGLVPGVGDFAYLTRPVLATYGSDWLYHGQMSAKFVKPVYDGDTVTARANPENPADSDDINLTLVNSSDGICAVGHAAQGKVGTPPQRNDYTETPPPAKSEPTVEAFPPGRALTHMGYTYDRHASALAATEKFRDPSPEFQGAKAMWHPALCLNDANLMLRNNINLGAWIHTASTVTYFDQPRDGEYLQWRGRVLDTYIKRDNVVTEVDLALFGERNTIVRVHHSAIIRLADAV